MNNLFFSDIVALLLKNKSMPNYQAERRIDIFINVFLDDILTKYLGKKVHYVCPEFALKKEVGNNSTKLDYLYASEDEVYFIELKTDKKSFDTNQLIHYFHHPNWGMWLDYLEDIVRTTSDKEKYATLIGILNECGMLIPDKRKRKIRVIYISPPLSESDLKRINNRFAIEKVKKMSDFTPDITKHNAEWQVLVEFMSSFDLCVFEIVMK